MAIDTKYYRELIITQRAHGLAPNTCVSMDDVLEMLDELDEMHKKYEELRDTSVSAKLILGDEEYEQYIDRLKKKRLKNNGMDNDY